MKGRNGEELLTGNLDATIFGALLNVVTKKKVLGGNYGFLVVLPWANNRVQGAEDLDSNPGAGLTDMYVQPISLGWTKPRADFTAAYGLTLPIGRYEDGAEQQYRPRHVRAGNPVRHHGLPEHAEERARGDRRDVRLLLGEEGQRNEGGQHPQPGGRRRRGLPQGRSHRRALAYFGVFKLTDDRFDARVPPRLLPDKNRVWGLGPEVTLALATKQAVYGFVTVRYQWELAARTSTEGAVWNILATFPLKPIRLSAP